MSTTEDDLAPNDILCVNTIVGIFESLVKKKGYNGPVAMMVLVKPDGSAHALIGEKDSQEAAAGYVREPDDINFKKVDVESVVKELDSELSDR